MHVHELEGARAIIEVAIDHLEFGGVISTSAKGYLTLVLGILNTHYLNNKVYGAPVSWVVNLVCLNTSGSYI